MPAGFLALTERSPYHKMFHSVPSCVASVRNVWACAIKNGKMLWNESNVDFGKGKKDVGSSTQAKDLREILGDGETPLATQTKEPPKNFSEKELKAKCVRLVNRPRLVEQLDSCKNLEAVAACERRAPRLPGCLCLPPLRPDAQK